MLEQRKLVVSHAPYWHNGSRVTTRSFHTILATVPAILFGLSQYGMPALGVVTLAVSTAVLWELAFNKLTKGRITVGDGNAVLLGLVFAMLIPATMPWWAVISGTFILIIIGKHIFGGIGSNAFHPVALAIAIMMVSWKDLFDFNAALVSYDFAFNTQYPLWAAKAFGAEAAAKFDLVDMLMGRQIGGIGATFGLGLIVGGIYLMIRGFIRWEIAASFLAGIYLAAMIFQMADPARFASPAFHLLTGYSLVGAFFLATEDSSSPVNVLPMVIYGLMGGIMTVLIRNIGAWVDGVVLAILVINLIQPLLDKIRPKALGKVA